MSSEAMSKVLDAVINWPQPPQVHFTGGEPFLHFSLLLEGVHQAVARGITNYVETSASWCIEEEETVERFNALRNAGLQAILISCSPFHAERIPPSRTLRAIRAAIEVFGTRRVIIYLPEFLDVVKRFDVERPTPLSRYEEVFGTEGAHRILWQGYGIISGGRSGYRLGHLVPKYPEEHFAEEDCLEEILFAHHSHFDLYGNYISGFCGGLTIGAWRELPQVLNDFRAGRYPKLVGVLIESGPYGLYELAKRELDYQALPDGYTGKCHLCVDVRQHLVGEDKFTELRPRAFYEHI